MIKFQGEAERAAPQIEGKKDKWKMIYESYECDYLPVKQLHKILNDNTGHVKSRSSKCNKCDFGNINTESEYIWESLPDYLITRTMTAPM